MALLQVICPASEARGGSWSQEGVIKFAGMITGTLARVLATGNVPFR